MEDRLVRRGLVIAIIVLFIATNVVSGLNIQLKNTTIPLITSRGNTLYVGGSGPGNYTKIQDAINDAVDGDTVFVFDDSSPYYENVVVTKSINLIGENRNTTVIDGMHKSDVIFIKSYGVYVCGFTIQNSIYDINRAGIRFENKGFIRIEQNIIHFNYMGIYLLFSDNCIISNNIIKSNNEYGIFQWHGGGNHIIVGNIIENNGNSGIAAQELINGIISYNIIRENNDGLNMQWHSNNTLVSNNIISENNYYGHWHVTNYHCTIRNNYYANNGWEELCVYQHEYVTGNNSIYHNTILGSAYDDGINIWYDEYPSGGNYWRYYYGKDNYHGQNQNIPGPDGIGDTPYQIPDRNNQDKYPLMDPIPITPFALYGPDEGITDIKYTFTTTTTDPKGEKLWYLFDWGDETNSGWIGPYDSGKTCSTSKKWYDGGDYKIKVKAKDVNNRETDWSQASPITVDEPPNKPIITGKKSIFGGLEYQYKFTATDPEEHDIYFKVDWDDEHKTDWLGPYNSGEEITLNHSWNKKDVYWIKAWAKDIFGGKSQQAMFKINVLTNDKSLQKNQRYKNLLITQFIENLINCFPIIDYILNG